MGKKGGVGVVVSLTCGVRWVMASGCLSSFRGIVRGVVRLVGSI